ncbi:S-adenosyl-L-methionine-dependent methyltransferase [Leptodontidium sp. MPI-SDFR-AT-0119]|nr:S-adenosyl-L-methionine-dependent methyltransferase [Leptodontidium sp. MPI-SDFR-AT-0119]
MAATTPPQEVTDAPSPAATSVPQGPFIEAVDGEFGENDSALGFDDNGSSTNSLSSSVHRHRQENGRRYHAYKDGVYHLPNDDSEQDRLDLQHHLFSLTFDGKLFTSPIEKPLHRVLDVGTGTGIWAIDFADEHPESEIIAIDLSPIQPSFAPPNVQFQIDDLEESWTFASKFDFIYARMMTGSFLNWPRFMEQSFEGLAPGGWIEFADIVFPARCDDDTMPPSTALAGFGNLYLEASQKVGRPTDSATRYKKQLEDAGFVNVKEVVYKWPQSAWPRDAKFRELGLWTMENWVGGLEGLSMAFFTRGLGWSKEELEVYLVKVRQDMRNRKIHAYWPIYVVYGQKPE